MAKDTNILEVLDYSPSITLLRARNYKFILEFLIGVLDETSTITQENLYSRLADYLNDTELEPDEEDTVSIFDTCEEKAEKYIKKWTDSGFLNNYTNEEGEILYQLSSHTCKVIDWIRSLKREEFIGTESKFKFIISQIKELVENTNANKEQRIEILKKKQLEIEQKIIRLQMMDSKVETFDEYQIVPRFLEINKRAKGAMISSVVGATTGLAGTVTSAMANTDKIRDDNTDSGKQKEKNLNTAANVLSGATTVASGVATVFNATQISAIKKVVAVAEKCTGVLK